MYKKGDCLRDCVTSKHKWFFSRREEGRWRITLIWHAYIKVSVFEVLTVMRHMYINALNKADLTVILLYNPIRQYSFSKLLSISLYYKQWIILNALKYVRKTVNVFFAMKTLEWIFYRLTLYCLMFEPKLERKFEFITCTL